MSAFICSDKHIATIAYYVANYFQIGFKELADKLKSMNIESVNYRYGEKKRKTRCALFIKSPLIVNKDDIAKLINCFNYQFSENNSIDYKAYSIMLETWISENKANPKNGNYWTI